jgi:hypothetical protein
MASTAPTVSCWMPTIICSISVVARDVRSASLRTSSATTAKPRPCSPARAASMAALRASRLVCPAISLITLAIDETCRARSSRAWMRPDASDTVREIFWIDWAASCTRVVPSPASWTASLESTEVSRALSEMWLELTVSSSMAAAMAEVASDWRSAAPEISSDAVAICVALLTSLSASLLISRTSWRRAPTIIPVAWSRLPAGAWRTSAVRSPAATRCITAAASLGSPPNSRKMPAPRRQPKKLSKASKAAEIPPKIHAIDW